MAKNYWWLDISIIRYNNIIMGYQKVIDLLDTAWNQSFKFRIKNCIEINDNAHRTYNKNSQIKFTSSVLNSRLSVYSDAYIHLRGTITTDETEEDTAKQLDERNICVIFKNYAPFTDCISEINNALIDNTKYLDVVLMI